ncbi:MAG: thiol-disulfide oxidoreductase DCC family protein [Phreatobacter sp.]
MSDGETLERYSWRRDPAVPAFPDDRSIIVFDGYCAFCSGWARFILKRDKARRFRLLPAQSPLGAALFRHFQLDPADYTTSILIEDGAAFLKSEGILRIFAALGLPWSLIRVGRVLPAGWRDRVYDVIARNRFRLGRRDSCYLTERGDEDRFLA